MNRDMSEDDVQKLRSKNLISENEIAFYAGDLVVAENVVSKERRVVESAKQILESNRRVLRG